MKIAFIGTCQLQRIGTMVEELCKREVLRARVIWNTPLFDTFAVNEAALFAALQEADIIYAQFEKGVNGWSTDRLQRYFPLKIVPTLLSFVSTPQLYYWQTGHPMPENLAYIDFRMLELYLRNQPVELVSDSYQALHISDSVIEAMIERERAKYARRFASGQISFDYAPTYAAVMAADRKSYHTCNHPSNVHLDWLANAILADCGSTLTIKLTNQIDLLSGWAPPSIHGPLTDRYSINCVEQSVETAAKRYYYYFDSVPRVTLEEELFASIWFREIRAPEAAIGTGKIALEQGV